MKTYDAMQEEPETTRFTPVVVPGKQSAPRDVMYLVRDGSVQVFRKWLAPTPAGQRLCAEVSLLRRGQRRARPVAGTVGFRFHGGDVLRRVLHHVVQRGCYFAVSPGENDTWEVQVRREDYVWLRDQVLTHILCRDYDVPDVEQAIQRLRAVAQDRENVEVAVEESEFVGIDGEPAQMVKVCLRLSVARRSERRAS